MHSILNRLWSFYWPGSSNDSIEDRRIQRSVTAIAWTVQTWFLLHGILAVWTLGWDDPFNLWGTYPFSLLWFVLVLHLNAFGFEKIARLCGRLLGTGYLLFLGVALGPSSQAPAYIIASLPLSLFGSRPQERLMRFAFIFPLLIGSYLALHVLHWNWKPIWDFPPAFLNYAAMFHAIGALALGGAMLTNLYRAMRDAETSVAREHARSERLLLNILPEEIAEELKSRNAVQPVRFDSASVLFTDFKGFTQIAESLSPEDLVHELDRCFSYFDAVVERHNLEKLKTIGDAFMCAGGIPVPNHTHAIDCVLAAIEIQAFMNQMKKLKTEKGLPYWELRLGIHSGPLVAGVIGEKKFAYDVWGDTVNTASRAESSGEVGRINVTKAAYELLKDFFVCEHRGTVPAKNKGEIDMYFVNGIRPDLSRDGDGRVPNEQFQARLGLAK